MGILSDLARELQKLTADVEELGYEDDSIDVVKWRYCRLLWQDKVQLEMVFQLTRIANHIQERNLLVRDMLSEEPPKEHDYGKE